MEKISTLMDGELDAHQSDQEYSRLKHDADARACWNTYHLIGDALRGEGNRTDVTARFAARLAAEPTVLAPRRRAPAKRATTYALSAAASLAAVALVGWVAVNNPLSPQGGQEVAVAPSPPAVPAAQSTQPAQLANVPSDGTMNEYVLAHQGLHGLAPYIRTVSAYTDKGRE